MTGQANAAPVSEDDLAAFLVDNPEADTLQDAPNNGDEPGDELDNSDADENPGGDAGAGSTCAEASVRREESGRSAVARLWRTSLRAAKRN